MPEGPETHRVAAELRGAIAGKRSTDVFFAFRHLKRFQEELTGSRVRSVDARGKAILTRFSNGLTVFSHNQLYGRWFVLPYGELPRTKRQLRFAIHTRDRSALLYSASDIEVLDDDDLETHRYLSRLGPDLLDRSLSVADALERLQSAAFARRQIGHLLLDQGFLAGVGNYLRSEILYDAGIHPSRRPVDLRVGELRALARAAVTLSRRSYRTGGVTNESDRVRDPKRNGARRSDYRFFVFGRAGKPCHRCRRRIRKTSVGSRRLYLCSGCQPVGGRVRS